MEHGKSLADLASGLSFFQIDNKAQTGSGGQSKAFCVTPRYLRACLTASPICVGVYFIREFPLGDSNEALGSMTGLANSGNIERIDQEYHTCLVVLSGAVLQALSAKLA